MRIAIVGFGAAAIGFLEAIKNSNHEIHIFETSKDVYSSSISGIRADGKLFVSKGMGGDMNVPTDIQMKLVEFYLSKTTSGEYETGSSFKDINYYREFYKHGFLPILSDFYHLGTDQLEKVLFNIYEEFSANKNFHFHFSHRVKNIEIENGNIIIDKEHTFDRAMIAVGRSGHQLVNSTLKQYPDLIIDNTKLDLGIRFELPNHIVADLNKEMYEFKIKYRSKTGYTVRTFCNNPSGYVVVENYDDFITVNGHAKFKSKSKNTNFAILTTISLTQPFNDPIGYGSHIAHLTNILAGSNKVILQTYGNLKESKRTKKLYRVDPTLDPEKYILGDINLAFPRRVIESLIDFIENLEKVIPGVAHPDNLVYAPEIKFYSNKVSNSILSNLKFIGDCSGQTRSIIYATAHGFMEAQKFLNAVKESL